MRVIVALVLVFLIFDSISLAAYTFPFVNWLLLPLVLLGVWFAIAQNERWLLLLPLAELMWGSFGSSLQWHIGGVRISLRILLFVLCVSYWAWQRLHGRLTPVRSFERDAFQYVALSLPVLWAILRGAGQGHPLGAVFYDGNAYLFLLYIPLWHLVYDRKTVPLLRALLMGVAVALSLKTLVLMNIFTNQYEALNVQYLYLWLRDTRIGEITATGTAIWRIFIQSQLFIGIAIMHAAVEIIKEKRIVIQRGIYLAILFAGIISSMSRSYWLGLCAALAILMAYALWRRLLSFSEAISVALRSIIVLVSAVVLIALVVLIPGGGKDLQGALTDRLSVDDAAGSSRAQLVGPLTDAIKEHPLIGQGFGATVTYRSNDPRIKNPTNPEGITTTFAFEWGYLDQWLKWGLFGMMLWAFVIVRQYWRGLRIILRKQEDAPWVTGLLAGLIFVLCVHVVSPYLNHPLGIGYLLLTMLVLQHSVEARYA